MALRLVAALLVGLIGLPGLAQAGWRGSLALTSDYVQRGRSQSGGDPAVQAEAGYLFDNGVLATLWASSAEVPQGPEVDVLVGWSRAFGSDWAWNLSAGYYAYPDSEPSAAYDRAEFAATLAWSDRFAGLLSWSPNTATESTRGVDRDPAYAAEVTAQQPLLSWLTVNGGLGYRGLSAADDYCYWNLTLGARRGRFLLELSRIGTDAGARARFGEDQAGDRTVVSLSMQFTGRAP